MIFDLGMQILIPIGLAFFFIFWYLSNIWTAPHVGGKRNPGAALMVSFFYTFKLFLIGAIILAISALILQSIPDLIKILKP